MTPAEIIYQRRLAVLEHAQRTGNVAETCRVFGISRTRYYSWKKRADAYGLAALMPKDRRAPKMPQATPTHVVERLLTLAVLEPTIGCRQYADRLGDQGFSIAKSTVQKVLVTHGLGRKRERLARAAAITAATTGLVTEAAREGEPTESICHLDSRSGRPRCCFASSALKAETLGMPRIWPVGQASSPSPRSGEELVRSGPRIPLRSALAGAFGSIASESASSILKPWTSIHRSGTGTGRPRHHWRWVRSPVGNSG